MARARKTNLAVGVILLVVGGVLLVTRFVPMESAPAWLLGLGAGLALIGIVGASYGALVGGISSTSNLPVRAASQNGR